MVLPQVGESGVREQSDLCAGEGFAESLQRRGGHYRIAKPIDAADENTAGRQGGGWRMVWHSNAFHLLCAILRPARGWTADCGLGTAIASLLPSVMHPEPIGRVAAHRRFECAVHVVHDRFD